MRGLMRIIWIRAARTIGRWFGGRARGVEEGAPEVSEYCAAELGALQGTGMAAARMLIADALDLRYRLPRLWGRVLTGGVRAWQARKIAEQTRAFVVGGLRRC